MPEPATARERLQRILQLIPLAHRDDGADIADLAHRLGVGAAAIVADLHLVAERADYLPPDAGSEVQVLIEGDRVSVWTTGQFRRPPRLSPDESMALALGLRALAGHAEDGSLAERRRALAARLEAHAPPPDDADAVHLAHARGTAGHRAALLDAVHRRVRCRIRYAKPSAAEPDEREIDPYVLVVDGDLWYALARCARNHDVRAFRLDRMERVEPLDAGFEVPVGFDPHDHLKDGHVFRASSAAVAEVRYAPAIARWPLERREAEPLPDGSAIARRRVADESWLARHVLQYGPDAELLQPPELRDRIREIAVRVSEMHEGKNVEW